MSSIKQIEAAIEKLPVSELFVLHRWMRERFESAWDEQLENDISQGKLTALAEQALNEYRAGQSLPLPLGEK